jgi:hypothetical protein
MRRWFYESLASLLLVALYAAWENRKKIAEVIEDLEGELHEQAQYRVAIQNALRNIRKLPETPEDPS